MTGVALRPSSPLRLSSSLHPRFQLRLGHGCLCGSRNHIRRARPRFKARNHSGWVASRSAANVFMGDDTTDHTSLLRRYRHVLLRHLSRPGKVFEWCIWCYGAAWSYCCSSWRELPFADNHTFFSLMTYKGLYTILCRTFVPNEFTSAASSAELQWLVELGDESTLFTPVVTEVSAASCASTHSYEEVTGWVADRAGLSQHAIKGEKSQGIRLTGCTNLRSQRPSNPFVPSIVPSHLSNPIDHPYTSSVGLTEPPQFHHFLILLSVYGLHLGYAHFVRCSFGVRVRVERGFRLREIASGGGQGAGFGNVQRQLQGRAESA